MKKILRSEQIREVDRLTISDFGLTSIELMEQACVSLYKWFESNISKDRRITLFCGPGNNGGDGLGLARLLLQEGFKNVNCYLINPEDILSKDCEINRDRLLNMGQEVKSLDTILDELDKFDLVVDAIFGSGLNRVPSGVFEKAISIINTLSNEIISIDIPSGLFSEFNYSLESVVKAHHTLCLEIPKLSLLLPKYSAFTGELSIVDIGLSAEAISQHETDKFYLTAQYVSTLVKKRRSFSHKGHYGHVKLLGGSRGKMGAVYLSTYAAMKVGAGLATAHVPTCGLEVMQSLLPEAMVECNEGQNKLESIVDVNGYTIGMGPGLGTDKLTAQVVKSVLETAKASIVIDADALNIISQNEWHSLIPKDSILTPHPKEFSRLVGSWKSEAEKLDKLKQLCGDLEIYVLLKGAYTIICSPDQTLYFNSTGNPGMAKAGSGDVLTGIITGLLAQGYSSLNASTLGVYLHGLSADIAVKDLHQNTIMASDLISYISNAYRYLEAFH